MKFHLAIFALASGLVGALEDCGGCTPTDPDCPPTFPVFPTCPGAKTCLMAAIPGITACVSATDYTEPDYKCLCQFENREALAIASLDCLEDTCTTEGVLDDVFNALLEFCGEVDTCYGDSISAKRLGGKGSSAKGLGGSSAKRLNGTSSSAAA